MTCDRSALDRNLEQMEREMANLPSDGFVQKGDRTPEQRQRLAEQVAQILDGLKSEAKPQSRPVGS